MFFSKYLIKIENFIYKKLNKQFCQEFSLRSCLKSNANVSFAVSGASRVRVEKAVFTRILHARGTRPILQARCLRYFSNSF